MSVIDGDFDPHSAWLHDIDPLGPLNDVTREAFLRMVDALAALRPDDGHDDEYDVDEECNDDGSGDDGNGTDALHRPPSDGDATAPADSMVPELEHIARPGLPAEALAAMAPDVELAAELEAVDIAEVDEYYLVEMAAAYQRLASWANARLTHVAGELARRPALGGRGALPSFVDVGNMAADELAPRLGLSRFASRRIVRNARYFANNFASTGHALATGQIDAQKASTIVSMLEEYPAEVAYLVQDAVIDDAGLQTHSQLVAAIRKAVIAVSHEDADHLHAKARSKRRVDHPRQLPDGMASVLAVLPATDAVALDLALEAAARTARQNGDQRTLDQLRADALALMGHGALETGYIGLPPAAGQGADPTAAPLGDDAAHSPSPTVPGPLPAPTGGTGPPPPTSAPAQVPTAAPTTSGPDRTAGRTTEPAGTAASPPVGQHGGTAVAIGETVGTTAPPSSSRSEGTAAPPRRSDGTTAPPPSDGHEGTAAPTGQHHGADAPAPEAGGASLRRCHMPIGQIGGQRTQVRITVPLSVLLPPDIAHQLGLPASKQAPSGPGATGTGAELVPLPDDDAMIEFLEREPVEVAELEGYGPISPAVARAAALGGTWRRIVTDPLSGTVLDHGRTRYRPPAALAELVRLRDRTCVRPGCSTPARICELDHVVPWGGAGTTALIDLGALCVRDHLIKTSGAFRLSHLGGGAFEWTTPSGHVYRRHRDGRVAQVTRQHAVTGPPPF